MIVGAGPAGLAAARTLRRRGLRLAVLEARSGPGGRTRTIKKYGVLFDLGAAFVTSFYSRTLALASEVGVRLHRPGFHPGRRGYPHDLLIDGRLRPHDIGSVLGFIRFPFVPPIQKVRLVLGILRSMTMPGLHVAEPCGLAAFDDEAASEWATRDIGPEGFTFFVRTAFEPFFFYEASAVSAAYVRALLRHSVAWRMLAPQAGMGALCAALASGLPIVFGAHVSVVERHESSLIVRHTAGVHRARAVIVAVPAPDVEKLVIPLDVRDRSILSDVSFAPAVRLSLGYEGDVRLARAAITPAGPGRRSVIGISSMTSWRADPRASGPEVVRVSASAARSRTLLGGSAEDVSRELLADCRELGVDLPAPDWVDVLEERHAIACTPAGHFRAAREFLGRRRAGLHFAGDWLSGSTIEGAVRSGEAAALRVAREVAGDVMEVGGDGKR